MTEFSAILRCPRCAGPLDALARCVACASGATRMGTILDFIGAQAEPGGRSTVEAFYGRFPFPGYGPSDDAAAILDRARRSPFLASLDAAIRPDATVLDAGCGTGQLAAFLSISGSRRTVVGVDACRASLETAEAFRSRAGLANLHFVRADVFALPLAREGFDVVVCRGVVHHTEDPYRAIREIALRVEAGGVLVLGFYESVARLPHRIRRGLARAAGRPLASLDPVLRRRDLDDRKKEAWIADQYCHPLERLLPLPRVMAALRAAGFEWLGSVPPARAGRSIFDRTPEPGPFARSLRRLRWALDSLRGEDAGLVCVLSRRQERS